MNRIEIVGLFTAMKELADNGQMDSIKNIINAVLDEAQLAKKDQSIDSNKEETKC
jgi:tetrahydromethanopterin S-methyltransferase subunit F